MMNDFLGLTAEQRSRIFSQVAFEKGIPVHAIEKDVWVTALLQLIFSMKDADKLLFKGGTSLSKAWGLISRFSEDIDLSVDRSLFGLDVEEPTVKQIKKLRKASSVFVRDTFFENITAAIKDSGLDKFLTVSVQPDGEGDKTYPEPRKIFIAYESVYEKEASYIKPVVTLEIGARSLSEPSLPAKVSSFVSEVFPNIDTQFRDVEINTASPRKTFLEKAFLLHEFFTSRNNLTANRHSRHLFDLEKLMDSEPCAGAVSDDELWNTIHRHRIFYTRLTDVDYTPDIRDRIVLVPPQSCIDSWAADYQSMQETMIYGTGNVLTFKDLISRIEELQQRFRNR